MARTRRRWPWIVAAAVAVAVLIPTLIVGIPILTHTDQGLSEQAQTAVQWPTTVSATGDDGRTRNVTVATPDGGAVDTSSLDVGERVVVTGEGFNPAQGIYVAICVIPDVATEKPGPCIGGVPDQSGESVEPGSVQYAPSNWINDDWAWKLFGARGYDDASKGTFTAYLEIGDPAVDGIDCSADACGIVTRNDHTALSDRVQDVYLPVRIVG